MDLAEKILNRFNISKPQRKFLLTLFAAILTARGKINFRNLSRYSDLSERTYSRQFAKPFEFVAFNREVINEGTGRENERIVVCDASFVSKSGKKTYGLDRFWNGCHSRTEKGLEVSSVAIVDVEKNTGFTLSVRQTEPTEAAQPTCPKPEQAPAKTGTKRKASKKAGTKKKGKAKSKKKHVEQEADEETRTDQYLQHLTDVRPFLSEDEKYVVVDGYFSKKKYVDGVCQLGLHQVGKLRGDANMRYLYTGPKRAHGSGRQKTYDGKVNWQDLSRFSYVDTQDGIAIYSLVLNHFSLKRNLRVVVLLDQRNKDKIRYVVLFSTDRELDAKTLVKYYKARFQIEFIFRDAKQFTGFCDSQARDRKRLDFHFNASLATLNLAKLEHLQTQPDTLPTAFSMASIKACYFNTFLLQKFFSMFDFDQSLIEKTPEYQKLRNYGKIAAQN